MKFSQVCSYFWRLLKNKKSLIFLFSIILFDKVNLFFQYYFFRQEIGDLMSLLLGNRGILMGGFNGVSLLFYFIPIFVITTFLEEKMEYPYFILHSGSRMKLVKNKVLLIGLVVVFLTLFIFIDMIFTHYLFKLLLYRKTIFFSVAYFSIFKLFLLKLLQYFFLGNSILILNYLVRMKFISWLILWTVALFMLLLPVGKWSLFFFIEQETIIHIPSFFPTLFYLFVVNLVLYFCLSVTGRSVSFNVESD